MYVSYLPCSVAGVIILLIVLWGAFETMVLPRSAGEGLRLTRFYFQGTWGVWRFLASRFRYTNPLRHTLLGVFGPLSLVFLIVLWSNLLVVSFALLLSGAGARFMSLGSIVSGNFGDCVYLSGVTLFTLGYGDQTPGSIATKFLCVLEAGGGFGLLATVIGYLPTLYQTFARREMTVLRLYVRTGTPTSARKLIECYRDAGAWSSLEVLLSQWEQWGAELLESHRSYPVLAFYRSQKEDSWLATAVILCQTYALIEEMCPEDASERGPLLIQADATRNIIVSALADLTTILGLKTDNGVNNALSRHLLLALPPFSLGGE